MAVNHHALFCWAIQSSQQVQQCGFAAAVGTHHRDKLARVHAEVDVVECNYGGLAFAIIRLLTRFVKKCRLSTCTTRSIIRHHRRTMLDTLRPAEVVSLMGWPNGEAERSLVIAATMHNFSVS
jgi:hypothetical protein